MSDGNVSSALPLAFGCGSVMGRVGRAQSLRALAHAWDNGIRHFDIARHYGMGEAERVIGDFLQGRRDQCVIATKFGYPVRSLSAVERALFPALRVGTGVANRLRRTLRRGSKPRPHFSAESLQASVAESLRQLRTGYLDIVYLHDASAANLGDTQLASAAQALLSTGTVRAFGICTDAVTVEQVAHGCPAWITAFQCEAEPFRSTPILTASAQRPLVRNHPFGSTERMQRFTTTLQQLERSRILTPELTYKLRDLDHACIVEALFGVILSQAENSVLVLSMMQEAHIRENVRAMQNNRFTLAELAQLRRHLASAAPDDGPAKHPPTAAPPSAASAP